MKKIEVENTDFFQTIEEKVEILRLKINEIIGLLSKQTQDNFWTEK